MSKKNKGKTHTISEEQKKLLHEAWNWCDEEDKSTEFMLSYMSDVAGVEYDAVVDFVCDPNTKRQ